MPWYKVLVIAAVDDAILFIKLIIPIIIVTVIVMIIMAIFK